MTNTNSKLFRLYAPCCWTEFCADSEARVVELHRDYHNTQFEKGRREAKI